MNNDEPVMDSSLAQALDGVLKRTLPAPTLPLDFHTRLNAAIRRSSTMVPAEQRAILEREYQAQLAELRQGYVRLRWRTLGTLIGAAFASGVAVALALPWLHATFGDIAVFAVPLAAMIFALVVGIRTWSLGVDGLRLFR